MSIVDDWSRRRSLWKLADEDSRTEYDADYARVTHSGSFRRLQGKTQILNLGDSDFYRTRLTHTLEVAQIASAIVRNLVKNATDHAAHPHLPSISLIQAIGLTHDLGHPPFGHGGEVALNYCMRNAGGFEGNGQTLRIASRLENFSEKDGYDFTRRTVLGIIKYPASYSRVVNTSILPCLDNTTTAINIIDRHKCKPPKCFFDSECDVFEWVLEPLNVQDRDAFQTIKTQDGKHSKALHKSLDATIMDVADDIAYGVHDLEDAIALGLINENAFRAGVDLEKCFTFLELLTERNETGNVYDAFVASLFGTGKVRKRCISRLVGHFIRAVNLKTEDEYIEHLVRYRVEMSASYRIFLDALQDLVVQNVIRNPSVQHLEFKGQKMVVSVFEALASDPELLLPSDAYATFEAAGNDLRMICDHVAGMTDGFLLRIRHKINASYFSF